MVTPVISDGQLKFKTEAESTESLAPLDAFMLMLAVQRLKPYYSSREQGPQFEKLHQEILSLQNQGYSPADVFRFEYAVRQRYEEDGTSLDAINFDLRLRYLMTPQLQRAAAPTPLMAQQAPRFGQGNNLPRALTRNDRHGAQVRETRASAQDVCKFFTQGRCHAEDGDVCSQGTHYCAGCNGIFSGRCKRCPRCAPDKQRPQPPQKQNRYGGGGGRGGEGRGDNKRRRDDGGR